MSFYANSIPVFGIATRTSASTPASFPIDVSEYVGGKLYIYVVSLAGTVPRLLPSWQYSPNGMYGTSAGYWLTWKTYGTTLRATGLAVLTLPDFADKWARMRFTVGGTSAAIKFQAWWVGKGQQ